MRKKINKNKKMKKKKSLAGRFFKILFSILIIYFMSLAVFVGYTVLKYTNSEGNKTSVVENIVSVVAPKLPRITNVLLVGVDNDETRTDTIMIASYNSENNEANLISIPRDTLVKVPQSRWSAMAKNYPALSKIKSRETKINAIHSYGKEQGMEFLELQLEELLKININYYAKVNLEAFRYLVDSVGGIEFDVPQRMVHKDPTQNLYINLNPGVQILDGDKAEQLVRFRGYSTADLQRIQVQQDFIKALLKTLLNKETILANPSAYLNTIIKYVDTNFKISDAIKYVKVLSNFNIENFNSYTLPGVPETINKVSYYVIDELEVDNFIYEVFNKKPSVISNENLESSKNKKIEVLNGGYTSGAAAKTKRTLERDGYNVFNIADSNYDKMKNTIIYVSKEGQGLDLEKYFDTSKVIVNSRIVEERQADIVVIIGIDETFNE